MKSRRTMAERITEEEKLRHGHFLQFLAVRFSKLLERLENETRYRGMKLTCAGKRNLPPVIIKRRNAEFLAIVALNLGHWPIPLRGLSDVLGQIHEVGLRTRYDSNKLTREGLDFLGFSRVYEQDQSKGNASGVHSIF